MTVSHLMHLRRIAGLGGLVIVAVLTAVLLAGPVAAHHGKGGHAGGDKGTNEAATFTFDVSGDLVGNVTVTKTVNANESLIHTGEPGGADLVLDMGSFLGENAGQSGWDGCFAQRSFSGVLQIVADKNDSGDGRSGFWFMAKGTDGTTDVKYGLSVTLVTIKPPPAAVWPYWLPVVGETATVTTVTGAAWKMNTSNGPGKKVACTGDGTTGGGTGDTLDFTITITRTG